MLKTYCAPVCFTDHANCDLRVISKNSSRSLGVVHFTSQETSTVQWPARLQLATRRGAGAAGVRPPPIVRSYRRRAGAGRQPGLEKGRASPPCSRSNSDTSIETRVKLKGDCLEYEVRSSVNSYPVRVPIKRHCAATERTETDVQCSSSTASGGLGSAAAAQITPWPMNERPLPGNAFRVLSTFASPPSLPFPSVRQSPPCHSPPPLLPSFPAANAGWHGGRNAVRVQGMG